MLGVTSTGNMTFTCPTLFARDCQTPDCATHSPTTRPGVTWVAACVCGAASGRRATRRGVERWVAWHQSVGVEGCDHVAHIEAVDPLFP
jgi:hypothetical protein